MDIIFRLRAVIWMLILALWLSLVFEFLRTDLATPAPAIHWLPPALQARRELEPAPPPLPSAELPMREEAPGTEALQHASQAAASPETPSGLPKGFVVSRTEHFIIYHDPGEPTLERFSAFLEELHQSMMLDLMHFSPWARSQSIVIYFFPDQDAYRRYTKRPAWSGGSSSVQKRTVFIYKSRDLRGILAHELCHIYFDGFFGKGEALPLWLSEGMATLLQVDRGLAAPGWLKSNLDNLADGGGFELSQFVDIKDTSNSRDDVVRLWYAQAYSLTRFLLRSQRGNQFYRFCRYLKEGEDLVRAMYLAYGMPFNKLSSLEFVWRYDLKTRKLTASAPARNFEGE
ncbi:MAG: hypothetical protein A3G41_00545 [Elusimicrobia bacterium RIFCSPLOWO2_12_FULL_59_9]|nr:MAG: hypothetical protein A3G41_00545 [Elusimicrobia bacterium RIFCSPLOWO2_12_FULL_59_9]